MKNDQEDVNEDGQDQSADADGEQGKKQDNEDEPASKHGERPDNLRRRSEWFQKRTGGR
ncbi:MAG: hypothetical protein ABR607_01755 [Pyrinomonadaceae bacterium]